jgi:hypothetical protein
VGGERRIHDGKIERRIVGDQDQIDAGLERRDARLADTVLTVVP